MQISRNQAVFASVAVIGVCLTAIFVLRSKTSFLNAFRLAFSSPEKRKALRKLQRIAEVISELSENFVEFAAAHQSLFSELSREKRPENAASSASSQNVSSYYHFDSSGNKFPSKWDSFDVEEELKRLDEEEQATVSDLAFLLCCCLFFCFFSIGFDVFGFWVEDCRTRAERSWERRGRRSDS